MKRFDHLNIVGLLGVCFDTPDGYPYLVLPFMANGNIRDYLKGKRVHLSDTDTLPEASTIIISIVLESLLTAHHAHVVFYRIVLYREFGLLLLA